MTSTTRRTFLGGAAAAAPFLALAGTFPGTSFPSPRPAIVPQGAKPSATVIDSVLEELIEVHAQMAHAPAGKVDLLRRTGRASSLFFDHLHETGSLTALDQLLRDNAGATIQEPAEVSISRIQQELGSRGYRVPAEAIRARFTSRTASRKAQALDRLREGGVHQFSRQLRREIEAAAANLQSRALRQVALTADLELSDKLCDGLALIAAALAVGCLLGIAPYCAAAALVYLLVSALEYFGFCE